MCLPLLPFCPSRAAGSFGSFCGLGLLFLSTVVRKPLPQKVSAGVFVYRGDAPEGSRWVTHQTHNMECSRQPGHPLELLVTSAQVLNFSVPRCSTTPSIIYLCAKSMGDSTR